MLLISRASISSVLLLSLGGVVAVANSNSLSPQFVAQDLMGQGPQQLGRPRLMQQLDLTPEQQQQLQSVRQQYASQISQQHQALRQAQQKLADMMAGTASDSEIRNQYRQVELLRQQVGELHLESMLAMRGVLTPEQRSRFAQLMEQRRDHFRDRMGHTRGLQG